MTATKSFDFVTGLLDTAITFSRTTSASNPATYFDSNGYIAAASNDQARFDYDPVTLACKGLLVEESRQNLLFPSEDLTNANWIKLASSVSANSGTSPANVADADKLVEDTSSSAHRVFGKSFTPSLTTYTFSFFVKAAGRDYCYIRLNNSGGDIVTGTVQISTATVTQTLSGIVSAQKCKDGWVRVTGTGTPASTATVTPEIRIANSGTYANYTGDGVSGIFIWGAQVEAGLFATSYIPTTTTALTRNADVATITGSNFTSFWNSVQGGAQVQTTPSTVSGVRPLVQFDDGTANEIITLRGNTTNPELYIVDGGTPQAQLDAGTISANTAYNLTGWWATNDCKARQDSGAVVTDTTATIPTVTQMRIGSDGTNYLNGTIATIGYYDSFFGRPIYTRRKNKVFPSLL